MKRILILGSTGSIGQNTLKVIRGFPHKFSVVGLSTNSNIDLLCRQFKLFKPRLVGVNDAGAGLRLRPQLNGRIKFFSGEDGISEMVQDRQIDEVVLAISGSGALRPLLKAIEAGKEIALANKEALVMAGSIIMQKARQKKIKIIPIDSEQSAIWQCLDGRDKTKIKRLYLTASGGPFRKLSLRRLKDISLAQALRHPRWQMGAKITVDSATLMNKGLEVLEAMHLFGVGPDKIKIIIHPEAIIHSMVEFVDGVILAQLSITDMRIPIQYALAYPERLSNSLASVDFCKLRELHFHKPDFKKFPCLGLAYQAAYAGGTLPVVMNAANEESVGAFLERRLKFFDIPRVIAGVMRKHRKINRPALDVILEADAWARSQARKIIYNLN